MLYGLIIGSLLYVPFVIVPLIGPLVAGISAGRIAKTSPQRGFLIGIASAAIGFLIWIFVVFPFFNVRPDSLLSGIFWLLFALWNVFTALIAGIGGILGSMLSLSERMLSSYKGTGRNIPREQTGTGAAETNASETNAPVFVICPACGTSNPENGASCVNCGKEMK